MSYVRNDSGLWYNLAGISAAYQPVRAPGPTMARYNQARGGENRYKATDGVAPVWAANTGWTFAGASSQYLATGISTAYGYTAIVRFSDFSGGGALFGIYKYSATTGGFAIFPNVSAKVYYYGAGALQVSPVLLAGVIGISGSNPYRSGKDDGDISAGTFPAFSDFYIGAIYNGTGAQSSTYMSGKIQAFAVYSRTLSPAEVWLVSRQMQYCDTNPDWSAWGRRRQWYYMPAGFLAAWASNSNQYIGPDNGVSL